MNDIPVPVLFLVALAAFVALRAWRFRRARAQLPQLLTEGGVIVDVRSADEFSAGANPRSINIPLDSLAARTGELDRTRPVIVCCASGTRSSAAAGILKRNGFERVINGGSWRNTLLD